jgi:hypothetical protein
MPWNQVLHLLELWMAPHYWLSRMRFKERVEHGYDSEEIHQEEFHKQVE